MKTINKILSIVMTGVLGQGLVSCVDDNDWDTDGSHSRLFGVIGSKVSVESERDASIDFANVEATVSFPGPKGAEYYIIEVSTDSLHDGIEMGSTSGSKVYGEDKSIVKSPAKIKGLEEDTKYYLRIKSKSESVADSKWIYYNEGTTFKTVAEQIFNEPTERDRHEYSLDVSWTYDDRVGFIRVSSADIEPMDFIIPDADKAAGKYTIKDLTPGTTYKIEMFNGTPEEKGKKRGTLTITTAPPMPDGDYAYVLDNMTEVLDQTLIDQIAADAKAAAGGADAYSATIGIPAEMTVKLHGISESDGSPTGITLPEGFSVTFFGMSGGDAPVLKFPKSLNLAGAHGYIRFENVQIVDDGCQYFINQSTSCNIAEFSIKNSRVSDFERSFIRTQGSDDYNISSIIVDDCIFTNMATGNGYSVFYFGTESTNVGKLELKNSTFNTSQRSFIEASKAPITEGVFIESCTFYNNVADGRYFMDAKGQLTNLTMKATILGKSFVEKAKGIRTDGTLTFSDCIRTNDCIYSSNDIKELEMREDLSSKDVFTDPDNGDFTLKINDKVGDPRWYKAE